MEETIKERLRKIVALMQDGGATEGERAAAQSHLNRLLDKYGLTLDEVLQVDAPTDRFLFTYTEAWEPRLLAQVAGFVRGGQVATYVHKDGRVQRRNEKYYWIELTYAEYIEVQHLWPQYRAAFQEEFDRFLSAFIQANGLGIPATEDDDSDLEDWDEIKRMLAMAGAIEKARVTRAHQLLEAERRP